MAFNTGFSKSQLAVLFVMYIITTVTSYLLFSVFGVVLVFTVAGFLVEVTRWANNSALKNDRRLAESIEKLTESMPPVADSDWTPLTIKEPSTYDLSRMLRTELVMFKKKTKKYGFMKLVGLLIVFVGAVFIAASEYGNGSMFLNTGILLFSAGTSLVLAGRSGKQALFKDVIMKRLVRLLSPSLQFKGGGLPARTVKDSRLIEVYDQLRSEDLISGSLYGHPIMFAEVKAYRKRTGYPMLGSGWGEPSNISWNGIIGQIKLSPQQSRNGEQLLQKPDLQRYLTTARSRFGDAEITVNGNSLYFAIKTDKKYLEPGSNPFESVQLAANQLSGILEFSANIFTLITSADEPAKKSA